jgi:FKBP-type peptidyl-prolyl cis-trans isomerase FklB
MDKISYALGLSIGNNFLSSGIKTINISDFSKAVEVILKGEQPEVSYEEAKQIINDLFEGLQKEKSDVNRQAGEEFLRINKEKAEVITLPSGLQYQILSESTGEKPQATDQVKCHYEGRLINGQIFDSSVQRGEPATFPLNRVIKGWTEGLQLMSIGSKYRFFIPSDLAYGTSGAGELIEPNSTLVFDVELLDIV